METSLVDAPPEVSESPAIRGRRKSSDSKELSQPQPSLYFSKAVRYAYSLRVMQLLPLAPLSLAASICLASSLLAGLLAAHYLVHRSPAAQIDTASLARLLHIRSPEGIAQWLSIQLWLLLAALTLLIYQLRRYTLNDYQARYRQWPLLAIGCAAMSLERASGALSLVGAELDVWCSSHLGLPGWVCVRLAAAGLAAIVCLRLCSDLTEFPASLTPWLLGWLAWGISGLLASGLLRLDIDAVHRDMLIGGGYLLGLLSVTFAATIYLRRNYQLAGQQLAKRSHNSGRLSQAAATATDEPSSGSKNRQRSGLRPAVPAADTAATSRITGWFRRGGSATHSDTPTAAKQLATERLDNESGTVSTNSTSTCTDRQHAWNSWFEKSPPAPKSARQPQPKQSRRGTGDGEPSETGQRSPETADPRPAGGSPAKVGRALIGLVLPLTTIRRLLPSRPPKLSIPKIAAPKVKLPKLKLPQMRLLPPESSQTPPAAKANQPSSASPSGTGRSTTTTSGNAASSNDRLESLRGQGSSFQSATASGGPASGASADSPHSRTAEPSSSSATERPLSRAERKALRRAARQNRDAA